MNQTAPCAIGISSWPHSYLNSHVRLFILSAPPALPHFFPQICTTKTSWSQQRSFLSEGICFKFNLFWMDRLVSGAVEISREVVSLWTGRSDQLFSMLWHLCLRDPTFTITEVNCWPMTLIVNNLKNKSMFNFYILRLISSLI